MGITALATFAGEISGGNSMSCNIRHGSGQSSININKENSLVLQSVEVMKGRIEFFFPNSTNFPILYSFHVPLNPYHSNVPVVDFP